MNWGLWLLIWLTVLYDKPIVSRGVCGVFACPPRLSLPTRTVSSQLSVDRLFDGSGKVDGDVVT